MTTAKVEFTNKLPVTVLAFLAAYLRLAHLFRVPSGAPFRLGGLFYEFSLQIIANGYALPKVIPFYSAGGIPFAYPPLGFYIQAFIIDIFSPPRFWIVNWLPPLVAVLAVPSFYFLLRKITDDEHLILGALFAYALMPAAFTNQIEAAGLAEAFGTLTLILYACFLLGVEKGKWRQILWAGLFLAATVMSSPGSAMGAVLFSLLFAGHKRLNGSKSFRKFALVGVIGFIASAPYWLMVIRNHGAAIFLTSISGQFQHAENGSFLARFIQSFFEFNYAGGEYALLWNALILAGLLWFLFQRKPFLPLLFFALALIPRESVWLTALVTPLFASAGLVKVALPLLETGFKKLPNKKVRLRFFTGIALLAFASIAINTTLATQTLIDDESWQISAAQIGELERLRKSIPPDAQVLIVGNGALREWAPQILQREVINTIWGLEWQPSEFIQVMTINKALDETQNWDEALNAVRAYTASGQIYILTDRENMLRLDAPAAGLITETPHFRLEKLNGLGN